MDFKLVGQITDVETIAVDRGIREVARLRKIYGPGRWKKMKGRGRIRFSDGSSAKVEVHWYEAHGIGKKEIKIKHLLAE